MASSLGFVSSSAVVTAKNQISHQSLTCSTFAPSSNSTLQRPCPRYTPAIQRNEITMKKGKVPRPMMPQRPQQQKTPLPEDGTPVFALFVRTTRTKLWYPLGAVKGDDRTKDLVNGLKNGFAKGMYQNALDRGIAQTVYGKDTNSKYVQAATRLYPQLKKYTSDLEFGYKIAAIGLEEQKTIVVGKEMAGSMFSSLTRGVSDFFKNITTPNKDKN